MRGKKDREVLQVRDIMVQARVLNIVGIWPVNSNYFASLGRWIFAMTTQIGTLCSLSLEIYRHCLDIDDTMDAFLMDLSSIVSVAKLLILRVNSKYTRALINSVMKDWSTVDDPSKKYIMTEYLKLGRIVSLMILHMGYVSGLSFIVKALYFGSHLPFHVYQSSANSSTNSNNPLKLDYLLATYCAYGSLPLFHHVCVLLSQGIYIYVNSVTHCGNDGLFFSLAMHLCGQFEVLKTDIAKIQFEGRAYQREIRLLVNRHCQLAELASDLERIFNMIILIQLLMSVLLMCVEGFVFLICLGTKDTVGLLKSLVLITTMLIQLFLYAYAGDVLQARTGEVAQAAYHSLWYRSRGRVAKDLLLIINRGNSPYSVTAGKFVSMNVFTFKEILKTSASYLSVLKLLMLIILRTGMYLDSSDAEKNLDSVILVSCAVLAIAKVVYFYVWCDDLTANFTSAVQDYDLRREDERVIMRWHAYVGKVVAVCGIFGAYFSSIFFVLMATFAKEKEAVNGTEKDRLKYPIPCEYTMEIINLPKKLSSAVFAVEYVMLMTTGSGNLGSDAMFLGIAFHLCGRVKILRLKFDKFINQNGGGREQFNAFIERHIYSLNLAKMLNETISSILIVQLSSSSILICVTGFQFILSLFTANIIMITKTFLVLNTLMVQIFGYCYVGENLKRQMESIG